MMADPQPASFEDCDSDDSSVTKPHTRQHASSATTVGRGKEPAARLAQGRDAASDSGYSSHASAHLASHHTAAPAVVVPAAPAPVRSSARTVPASSKPPPIIHRSNSTRSSSRSHTVSTPAQAPEVCTNPNCSDPACNSERRYVLPHHPPPQAAPYQQPHPQQQAPAPQPRQYPMGPPPVPLARQRSGSTSRPTRPVSVHGYSVPLIHTSFDASQRGPPLSNSAFYGYPQSSPYAPSPQTMGGMLPPAPVEPYVPPSPGLGPMSPTFPTSAPKYSARTANPMVPGLGPTRIGPMAPQPGPPPKQYASARQSTIEGPEYSHSDSYTSSESESSDDDRFYERSHRRRSTTSKNDRLLAAAPDAARSGRPGMPKSHTTSDVSRKGRSRDRKQIEYPYRPPHSDNGLEYHSSDPWDSDLTRKASIGLERRGTISTTRSSRRPSVSTTASSGRTKATTLSSMSDFSKVTIEDSKGRRTVYMPKDELARRLREQHLEDQRRDQGYGDQLRAQDAAAAYQSKIGGGDPHELTAENMRRQQNRKSASSNVGSTRSHKSTGSKTSKTSKVTEGFRIQNGETILHISGDTHLQMIPSEDGGPATFVIGSSTTGKDSGYHTSSKSSDSRNGRSHVVHTRMDDFDEEDYRRAARYAGRRE